MTNPPRSTTRRLLSLPSHWPSMAVLRLARLSKVRNHCSRRKCVLFRLLCTLASRTRRERRPSLPLCTLIPIRGAPLPLNGTLALCGDAGATCCDATDDKALRDQHQAANASDDAYAAVLKALLCANCNPYSADLFDAGPKLRTMPFLCSSASSAAISAHQSKESAVGPWVQYVRGCHRSGA